MSENHDRATGDEVFIVIEDVQAGDKIRLLDEDDFVMVDDVFERRVPGTYTLWIVGDKLPTRMSRGDFVELAISGGKRHE